MAELMPLVQRLRDEAEEHPTAYESDRRRKALLIEAADEVARLREALAGAVHVLDLLRTYGRVKYDYAQGRAGSMVNVAVVIDAGRAVLEPNAKAPEPQR